MADNPAQGVVDTINATVMTPAKKGMDMLSGALDPSSYQFLLDALMKLKGGTQPTMQATPSRGDINLPPESGQFDPMLPAAHLPPEVRQRMVADALQQRMSQQGR